MSVNYLHISQGPENQFSFHPDRPCRVRRGFQNPQIINLGGKRSDPGDPIRDILRREQN